MKPVAGLKIERALTCSTNALPSGIAVQGACQRGAGGTQYFRFHRAGLHPLHQESDLMKTGMNLLLWTTHVTAEHFPILEKLKKTGFDGVEIPIFEGDTAHYKALRKELDNQGLKCTTVTVATPEANPISPEAAVREAAVERLRRIIEFTAVLGGEIMAGPYHSPLAVFSGAG